MSKWKTTKVTDLPDPFEGLFDRSIEKENATKHDYVASEKKWSETKIKIQILAESFAEGSMRQAFKAKFIEGDDMWSNARNAVCKGPASSELVNRHFSQKSLNKMSRNFKSSKILNFRRFQNFQNSKSSKIWHNFHIFQISLKQNFPKNRILLKNTFVLKTRILTKTTSSFNQRQS